MSDSAALILPAYPISDSLLLRDHTTFRVGGPAKRFVVARTEEELIATVHAADQAGEPVLVLSGGSNMVVADQGFDGVVVRVATQGVQVEVSDCAGATLTVAAGESFDDLVALTVANEWSGLEALSGIPGLVGTTPMQNVGAYGADVASRIAQVRVWDRVESRIRTLSAAECEFGYRTSLFKRDAERFLIVQVVFQLRLGSMGQPVQYPQLAAALGVEVGARAPLPVVRAAVLAIRSEKGMVLDAADHDTWSAGSFFTNPELTTSEAANLPADAPRFPAGEVVKTSAAWLIEHAGFHRGYGHPPVTLSSKHTLAITNRGGASAEQVLALAGEIRAGVQKAFGVLLNPEPILVNCRLEGEPDSD